MAEARHKVLLAAKKIVDEARQREKDAKREAAQFLDPVAKLRAQPLKVAGTMITLAPVAEELEADIKEAKGVIQALDREESQTSAASEKAAKGGKGVEALTHAAATLSAITRDLGRTERANTAFGRRREELAAELEKATKARKGLADLAAAAERAHKEHHKAAADAEIQGKLNRQVLDLLRESRRATKDAQTRVSKLQGVAAAANKTNAAAEKARLGSKTE